MCNLYTNDRRKHRALARKLNLDLPFPEISEGPREIYPDKLTDVVRMNAKGVAEYTEMRWGFPKTEQSKGYVTNVRHPEKPFWRYWTEAQYRALVPATTFAEWSNGAVRGNHWFQMADEEGFCFAGIWRPWSGVRGTKAQPVDGEHRLFAILTTEANRTIRPVHPQAMPVILREDDWDTWLTGSVEEALALQKPLPDDEMKSAEAPPSQPPPPKKQGSLF